jgi:catechol 2,3-dioxygenase-like lactoylglutathione lyase family enzyme
MVNDMDESLGFYRDVLGMHVFYQQEISSGEGEMLGVPGARVRVASLQSQGSVEGMVGLLAFQSPELRPRQAIMKKLTTPDVVLVFMTEDMTSLYARVQERRVRIQSPPIEYEIPERGTSVGMSFCDPNGVLIELTQFGPLKREGQVP